jgi:hypothetical protein
MQKYQPLALKLPWGLSLPYVSLHTPFFRVLHLGRGLNLYKAASALVRNHG